MNKLNTTRTTAKIIVSISAGWTVGNIITNNVTPSKPYHKVFVWVGAFVIGGIVAAKAEAYTDQRINEIVAAWNKAEAEAAKTY